MLLLLLLCTSKTSISTDAPAASRAGGCLGAGDSALSPQCPAQGDSAPWSHSRRRGGSGLPVTYREALPAALVATAPTAVIVLQAQEHQRGEDHLPAREASQTGADTGRESLRRPAVCRATSLISDSGLVGMARTCRARVAKHR